MNDLYTTVQLSKKDALEFVRFQKHYAFVELMDSLGVFNVQNGTVEIHFDQFGQIGSVDIKRRFRMPKGV